MTDILEVLRARRLRSIKASIAFNEKRDAMVSEKAKVVKETLSTLDGSEPKDVEEVRMAALYYRMVDEYYANPAIRMPHTMTSKGLSLWRRVVISCAEAGVDQEAYMRAQFDYFHKCFGRPPKIYQLATDKAQERAIAYVAANKVTKRVVGNDIRHKADVASVMRSAEKQMLTICRAQDMTREEVYRNLVIPGFITFPKVYLDADPIYKKVIDE